MAFFRRYFPFLAEKYGLRPVRTGHHVRTFDQFFSACTPDDHETEELTTHRPTAAAQTTTAAAARRRRHRPWLLPPWRRQRCAGARCAGARCACRLHLLLSRCVACACACGFGCGPRPLLHRCPLRTEKRKLPELTCELGLSPSGARTRAEPRDKVHLMPAAGEENFAPRPESSAKMTGSRMAFASRG